MNAPGDAAAAPSGLSEQTRSDAKAPDARQHKRQEAAIARLRPDAIQLLIAASVYREPVDLGALLFQVGRQDWASDQQPGDVAADSGSDTAAPGSAEGGNPPAHLRNHGSAGHGSTPARQAVPCAFPASPHRPHFLHLLRVPKSPGTRSVAAYQPSAHA